MHDRRRKIQSCYESGPIFFNDRSFYKIHIRKLRQKERNQFMQT